MDEEINDCYNPQVWLSHSYDLSGISLEAGKDYILTLTMDSLVGGGAYATWDKISLSDLTKAQLIASTSSSVPQDAVLQWANAG